MNLDLRKIKPKIFRISLKIQGLINPSKYLNLQELQKL